MSSPAATLAIGSTTINRSTYDVRLIRCTAYRRGGFGDLTFAQRGLTLSAIATPDPWWGQPVTLTLGSTLVFSGDVGRGAQYQSPKFGWVREYHCRDLRDRADRVPVTDSVTGTDRVIFNQTDVDINRIASRLGRTIGQMVLEVLQMPAIQAGLSGYGIGGYTSAGTGATATATVSGGVVTVVVNTAGSGYTSAPTVFLSGGGGTYTSATPTMLGNTVASVAVTGSSGYLSPPAVIFSTLPAVTLSDLNNFTIIPSYAVHFAGERVLATIDQNVTSTHRNFRLWVRPDGVIRFLDERAFSTLGVTLNSPDDSADCWDLPSLTCDWNDCYQRVVVQGDEWIEGVTLGWQPAAGSSRTDDGIDQSLFAWGSYSVAAAIAAWTPQDWINLSQPPSVGAANTDRGTCTCSDTLHVVMTSSDATRTYAANYWDQESANHLGVIEVASDVLTDVTMKVQRRIVASTALTAGSTYTATLDSALPSTSYNTYRLYGLGGGEENVWTLWKVTNPAIAGRLRPFFPYAVAQRNSASNAAARTQAAVATVFATSTGGYTWSNTCGVTVDPDAGTIRLDQPAPLVVGTISQPVTPTDVQVYVPVSKGPLTAIYPPNVGGVPQYSGTSAALGLSLTKTVQVREWRDPGNQANMLVFAQELQNSIRDVIWEGQAVYHGLNTSVLAFGVALEFTGSGYTTGLESTPINVASCTVEFGEDESTATNYRTLCELSNRRAPFTGQYLFRPAQLGSPLGLMGGSLNLAGRGPALPDYSGVQPGVAAAQSAASLQDAALQSASAIPTGPQWTGGAVIPDLPTGNAMAGPGGLGRGPGQALRERIAALHAADVSASYGAPLPTAAESAPESESESEPESEE